jgi:hypothetical protein
MTFASARWFGVGRVVVRSWCALAVTWPLWALAGAGCGVSIIGGVVDDDGAPRDSGPGPGDAGATAPDAAPGGGHLPAFCAAYPPADPGAVAQSTRVFYGDDGHLHYTSDADRNRVPDFGFAGYHFGERALPSYPEVKRIGPGDGDDTARLQAAIDEVGERRPDADGVRGALVLDPGDYQISGTLKVGQSGVVLRGSGDGADPAVDTILHATGDDPHQRTVLSVGAGGSDAWRNALSGTQADITSAFVPVGAASFDVDHPEHFSVGQRVMVEHPSTQAWIDALGGGGAMVAWTPGQLDILYLRRVVAVSGHTLTIDVPLFDHLDRALAQSVVYAVDDRSLVRESGLEKLRLVVESAGGTDENHAWSAFAVQGAEDSWVAGVTAAGFGYAGVKVQSSDRITVSHARAIDPVGIIDGGRFYNFAVDDFAQEVLFVDCEASGARHAFVSNGTSTVSDVVFLRGRSLVTHNSSEGHRRWSQGLLYDNVSEVNPGSGTVIGLYNRGDWGTQHGWAAVHSVLWRYDTAGKQAILQKPPTAQNYAIGTMGPVTGTGPFAGGPGFIEPIEGDLAPHSLYEAQLCDRLVRAQEGP